MSGKADSGASGWAFRQHRWADRLVITQAATTAVRMAATLSKETSPSFTMKTAAMEPVTTLAMGTKMLSYNTS